MVLVAGPSQLPVRPDEAVAALLRTRRERAVPGRYEEDACALA
jgi:hypothetical protein